MVQGGLKNKTKPHFLDNPEGKFSVSCCKQDYNEELVIFVWI